MTNADRDLFERLGENFRPASDGRVAVAVSGGSDSVALLILLNDVIRDSGGSLFAVTVDHGLRPEAAEEAKGVADLCDHLGVPHTTLRWQGWDGGGNLQDQARRARYELMTEWAKTQNISILAVGHTADDQAETVLMRLGRSSGVDGLSGMSPVRNENGVTLVRPLLNCRREDLRACLVRRGISWIDDPSNEDEKYERVRVRGLLKQLAPTGISTQALADMAQNMLRAREALNWYSFLAAQECASVEAGCVVLDARAFRTLPEEIARRVLATALAWINGGGYPPRRQPMLAFLHKARRGVSATLAGCHMLVHKGQIWICREFRAVEKLVSDCWDHWDNRWTTIGPAQNTHCVRALGPDGIAQCVPNANKSLPRIALLSSPSIWQDQTLIAAPLAGFGQGWRVELTRTAQEFHAMTLSH